MKLLLLESRSNFGKKINCQTVFQKWYGAYDARVRVCFVIVAKPRNILFATSFLDLFEGKGITISTKRSHHWKTIPINVGCRGFGVERIPRLQHNMLFITSIPSVKRMWNVKVWGGLPGVLCLEVLL
jgi:hypothetical protein